MNLYYYPNRPTLIPADSEQPMNPRPTYLNQLEASGKYIAEQKWNGDNCLIYTGSKPEFWNRTHTQLKYRPTEDVLKELRVFPKDCVINAELIHNKTKTIKDLLICHCVMIWKGNPLIGKTWGDSRKILEDLPLPLTIAKQFNYANHVLLSRIWTEGFWDLFQLADGENIEGIILKNPKGKLVFSLSPLTDVPWMLKVRKPCKKYNF
jgi:hypothetical protein